ncbi:TPA: hypothetical protein ACN7M6_005855, partial [Klebsiella michiganensis]
EVSDIRHHPHAVLRHAVITMSARLLLCLADFGAPAFRSKLSVSLSKNAQMTCEQQSTDEQMKLKRLPS